MNKTLKWRLSKLPTVEELTSLEKKKILTKEEVKEILFNNETKENIDIESYKNEIKFLREVVSTLADKQKISRVICKQIPVYIDQPFYQSYYLWGNGNLCGASTTTGSIDATTTTAGSIDATTTAYTSLVGATSMTDSFSDIKTF